ncbi:hypothetical protein GCM10029976_046330 [Kribbella albertanoniae]
MIAWMTATQSTVAISAKLAFVIKSPPPSSTTVEYGPLPKLRLTRITVTSPTADRQNPIRSKALLASPGARGGA